MHYRSRSSGQGHRSQKSRKFLFSQCKTSIGNNSHSVTHRAVLFRVFRYSSYSFPASCIARKAAALLRCTARRRLAGRRRHCRQLSNGEHCLPDTRGTFATERISVPQPVSEITYNVSSGTLNHNQLPTWSTGHSLTTFSRSWVQTQGPHYLRIMKPPLNLPLKMAEWQ